MKTNFLVVIICIIFSCGTHSTRQETEKTHSTFLLKKLNLSPSVLQMNATNKIIKQSDTRRIELSGTQKTTLFAWNSDIIINDNAYLYNIKEVYKNVFLFSVLMENISGENFYTLTTDTSAMKLDYIYFSDGDFFDVIDQNSDNETGLFITKYFQFLNDTSISIKSIIIEEKKNRHNGVVLTTQKDSITHDYFINRKGLFELVHKDSIRLIK
jgi:hypothetical protein